MNTAARPRTHMRRCNFLSRTLAESGSLAFKVEAAGPAGVGGSIRDIGDSGMGFRSV